MANPAKILFNQFNEWYKDDWAKSVRKDSKSLAQHRIMARHLDDLIAMMASDGKRVSVYQRHFPAWARFLFAYSGGWETGSKNLLSYSSLEHLETLIEYCDGYCLRADEEKFDDLKAYLDRVKQALDDDETLPSTVKLSTRTLVENLVTIIDSYAIYGSAGRCFAASAWESRDGCYAKQEVRYLAKDSRQVRFSLACKSASRAANRGGP